MSKIADYLKSVPFVYFQAHLWFAYAIVYTFFGVWVIAAVVALAAVKEFWFDPRYETGETIHSGVAHFVGYVSGITLALFVHLCTS